MSRDSTLAGRAGRFLLLLGFGWLIKWSAGQPLTEATRNILVPVSGFFLPLPAFRRGNFITVFCLGKDHMA